MQVYPSPTCQCLASSSKYRTSNFPNGNDNLGVVNLRCDFSKSWDLNLRTVAMDEDNLDEFEPPDSWKWYVISAKNIHCHSLKKYIFEDVKRKLDF